MTECTVVEYTISMIGWSAIVTVTRPRGCGFPDVAEVDAAVRDWGARKDSAVTTASQLLESLDDHLCEQFASPEALSFVHTKLLFGQRVSAWGL